MVGARLLQAALVAAVVFAPLAQAGWSVPEGEPYEAEARTIEGRPAIRDNLVFRDGLLAGIGHAWGQDPGRAGDGVAWRWDGDTFQAVPLPAAQDGRTTAIAAGHGHVAWLSGPDPGNVTFESSLFLLDVGRGGAPERVSGPAVHSPPVINGPWLAFASRPVGIDGDDVTLHRIDLRTGVHEAWPSPAAGPCEPWTAMVGDDLVLSAGLTCFRDEDGGLALWRPGEAATRALTTDPKPFLMQADGPRILWTAYREGEGRGTNVYLADTATGAERRVSASPGRECYATLSGGLVAWLDVRSEPDDRRQPEYSIYFSDLGTQNEYQVQGTLRSTGGPALDGRWLAYNDAEGRLVALQLPGDGDLLKVRPQALPKPAEEAVGNAATAATGAARETAENATSMVVDLVANVTVDVAWDLDGDGAFEAGGPLEVGANDTRTVLARAVDALGRVAVLAVRLPLLSPAPAGQVGGVAGSIDGDGSQETSHARGAPIPAPPAAALAALVATLALARRRS